MTAPHWEPVDSPTADLLHLVADGGHPSADHEWDIFVDAVRTVSGCTGFVDQNAVRPLIRGKVAPKRVGAFYRRACLEGWLAPSERWVISDDTQGRNAGRPMRGYVVTEAAA